MGGSDATTHSMGPVVTRTQAPVEAALLKQKSGLRNRHGVTKPFTPRPLKTALERTTRWRSGYFAAVSRASETPEFRAMAKACHVAPSLLVQYLTTMVEYSNTAGKVVFPSRRKISTKLGRSVRHVARLRQAAVALGFEETAGRYYKRSDDVVRRTSNASRLHVPKLFLPKPIPPKRRVAPVPEPVSPQALAAEEALDAYLSPTGGTRTPVIPTPGPGVAVVVPDQANQPQSEPERPRRSKKSPSTRGHLAEARRALERGPP